VASRLALRLALPLALTGLVALGAAGPAHAEPPPPLLPPPPTIEIDVAKQVITTPGGSNTVPFELYSAGITARDLIVDFGTAAVPVDPRIGLKLPAECEDNSCPLGDVEGGKSRAFSFTVQPTADLPKAGADLQLVVRDDSGRWQETATVTILRGGLGIDLQTAPIPDVALTAGKAAVLPISVRNNGNKTADGVAIALSGQPYVTFPNNYSNCVDVESPQGIICSFDIDLAPGAVFTVSPSTPLTVAADTVAPGPADYKAGVRAFGLTDDSADAGLAAARKAVRQPGTKLALVPVMQGLAVADPSEQNEWDNATSFTVKVALNPADSVALGDTFEGKVGETKTIEVGFRNDGPAVVLGPGKQWTQSAKVRIPSGLALTKVDKKCVPNADGEPSWDNPGQISGHDYVCVATDPQTVGKKQLFSFTAKIQNGDNKDKGSITVDGGVQDTKKDNNVAKIEVKLTTTGTGNGTGGTGGSGGGLPITGAPTGQIAATGLLLVLAGVFALVLTRRRPTA